MALNALADLVQNSALLNPYSWPRARITRSQRVLSSSYVWKFFDTDRSKTCLCACLAGLARLPRNPESLATPSDVFEDLLSFAWAALLAEDGAIDQLAFRGPPS